MTAKRAAFALVAALAAAPPPHRSTVRIEAGTLAGVRNGSVEVFRGIPYAAPPVGPLRWHAPEPAPHWQGVRDARRYGDACPQPGGHKEAWAPVTGRQSEVSACFEPELVGPSEPHHWPDPNICECRVESNTSSERPVCGSIRTSRRWVLAFSRRHSNVSPAGTQPWIMF